MRHLSGLDSLFLDLETRACPMHVGLVLVFDPRTAGPGFGFGSVVDFVASRLDEVPAFRRRLVRAPLNLDLPYWVDDPDFEIEHHVLHRSLPRGGGVAALWRLTAELFSRPLNRALPLWQFVYLDGLPRGQVALICKVHHACVDGVSGADLLSRMMDSTRNAALPAPRSWRGEPLPSPLRLGMHTLGALLRQPLETARLLRDTVPALFTAERARLAHRRAARGRDLGRDHAQVPRTVLNTMITSRRSFAAGSLPLSRIRALRRAAGVSVNDVVLCLCAEALRGWLLERGELPAETLWAGVPVSVRREDERGQLGNHVMMARTALHTEIADPLERLERISGQMRRVKRQDGAVPARLLLDWLDLPAPALLVQAARLYENFAVGDRLQPPFNVVISNVPGSSGVQYLAGARLVHSYPVSIPYHGLALNITVMSYRDRLDYGLSAHRDTVPEPAALGARIDAALAGLEAALGARS